MSPTVESTTAAGEALTLTCPAPGKLNLFLLVTGRRADGYHMLQTLFRFIDFGDTLTFRVRDDGRDPARAPSSPVCRPRARPDACARRGCCSRRRDAALGVEIALEKRLPVGGGLGRRQLGCGDHAAGAEPAVGACGCRASRLQELALQLGADVPVFVFGRNALAEGIGEQLQAVDLPSRLVSGAGAAGSGFHRRRVRRP